MIVRTWRAEAARSGTGAYQRHFREAVAPSLRAVDGFTEAFLCMRAIDDDRVEFLVMTLWRSMETIERFAGDDISRAVVEPDAAAALLGFDDRVTHYEIIETVN